MNQHCWQKHFVAAMAKHLPPSASKLRLIDLDGRAGALLAKRRGDLEILSLAPENLHQLSTPWSSVDAVVGLDVELGAHLLAHVDELLRPGGRFIAVLPRGQVNQAWVHLLEGHGFIRILVEAAVDDLGVLIRGEKPHSTSKTLERIQDVAREDADLLNLDEYRGRYLHLLIRQSPNKPIWQLNAKEKIAWRALALQGGNRTAFVAFSSLPKAVGFLQPAVLAGVVSDVNKVGKFAKEIAESWPSDLVLNPTLESIQDKSLIWLSVDPETAAVPDE